MAMFPLMEKALVGIEPDDVNGGIQMVVQQGIAQIQ